MMNTPAVALSGILAQLNLLDSIAEFHPQNEDGKFLGTIRAAVVALLRRDAA